MPIFKCTKCHHEWEGQKTKSICSWCNSKGKILQEKSELEDFIENFDFESLFKNMRDAYDK